MVVREVRARLPIVVIPVAGVTATELGEYPGADALIV
jgi:hypothetical protein